VKEAVAFACERYRLYYERILRPATDSFRLSLDDGPIRLHEAFGTNLFAAHAIDYLLEIRSADGAPGRRHDLVTRFDEMFFVEGGRFQNAKFRLVDAINNALKHVKIDPKRYPDLVTRYGPISFQSLAEDEGRVICLLAGYRFDYCRVVLRHVLNTLVDFEFGDLEGVLDFARGTASVAAYDLDAAREDDPIDEMIEFVNPVCGDCGEGESNCLCATFVYDGKSGEFVPIRDEAFDLEDTMSRISGAYPRES